jgi:hypothetical protein
MKNNDLGFNKAHHFVLGYYHQINKNWKLATEIYYQNQFNLVVGKTLPISRVGGSDLNFESIDLDNGGTGRNYGIEIAIERAFINGYYVLANTSLFESNYTANDGVLRNSKYNSKYIFNLVGGKEWRLGERKGKTNYLILNLSATYSGPQYYTPIDLEKSIEESRTRIDYNNPNSEKQDPFLLIDASIIFKRNRKKSNSQLTLQITNILNKKPITGPVYDRDQEIEGVIYGTGLVPLLSWRTNF